MTVRLSVVVPVYNEAATVTAVVRDLRGRDGVAEVVCVDDGSTDGTPACLRELAAEDRPGAALVVVSQPANRGKGAAVRRGFTAATGDVCVIFDADREYDPADLAPLFARIRDGGADVVYGSRFLGRTDRPGARAHYLGNRFLTWATNVLYRSRLTDMETCLKMFHRRVLDSIRLVEDGFEIEPELTARTLRAGWVIQELPVAYAPRSQAEGKKIRWYHGFKALLTLVKCRFFR